MFSRRFLPSVAAALVLVTVSATTASASGANLASGTTYFETAARIYGYTTSYDYWSVIADFPEQQVPFELTLSGADGLQAQDEYFGGTQFIAVDSNAGYAPPQGYTARAFSSDGPSQAYAIEASYGTKELTIPTPTHHGTTGPGDPDLADFELPNNEAVAVTDIYVTAGEKFWVEGPDEYDALYFIDPNPANPATFVAVNREGAAELQEAQTIDNCTLYTATYTGYAGLVATTNTYPQTTSTGGDLFALHAYDPTQPDYCPMADWPGATP